jgi:hypothetical protein
MSKDDYKVGKGRPPKHTRFKKGQSGNPSGRKKLPDVVEAAARVLEKKVSVTEDGVRKKMPAIDAVLIKQLAKAMTGDIRAAEFLIKIVANDNTRRGDGGQEEDDTHDAGNAAIIERYYERYAPRPKAGGHHE